MTLGYPFRQQNGPYSNRDCINIWDKIVYPAMSTDHRFWTLSCGDHWVYLKYRNRDKENIDLRILSRGLSELTLRRDLTTKDNVQIKYPTSLLKTEETSSGTITRQRLAGGCYQSFVMSSVKCALFKDLTYSSLTMFYTSSSKPSSQATSYIR